MCCSLCSYVYIIVFFFKQKTAYEMRISDWSSDVCSSDLAEVEMQFIDCGRALHIYTNGEAREFVRVDRMPNTYRRTEAQGGFALVVDYVQRTPRQLDVRWDFNGQATHPGSLTWLRPLPSRSEEHTSELQSLMRISYAVFCLTKKNN